jgi:Tfp pilus assembly protein PilN
MIEINLQSGRKDGGPLAGLDLSKINLKMLGLALVIYFVPEGFLVEMWDSEIDKVQSSNQELRSEFKKLNSKVRSMKTYEEQVQALKEQEKKLSRKLQVVKEIINKRQNPFQVYFYLANNIPKDVWINEMIMDDRKLTLKGFSSSWKSIGKFLENLKNSIFFDKNIQYEQPQSDGTESAADKRAEAFTIVANIARFE